MVSNFWKIGQNFEISKLEVAKGQSTCVIFFATSFITTRITHKICLECGCNEEGDANGNNCLQTSGACTCKSGYIGDKCQGKP